MLIQPILYNENMTQIFGPLRTYGIQASTGLETATEGVTKAAEADKLLGAKENFSIVLDKLSELKGGPPEVSKFGMAGGLENPSRYFNRYISSGSAKDTAVEASQLADALRNPPPVQPEVFGSLLTAVEQELARSPDKLEALNSKMELFKVEAEDAAARYQQGISGMKKMMDELRQG